MSDCEDSKWFGLRVSFLFGAPLLLSVRCHQMFVCGPVRLSYRI
jgi:hypothetical protein